MNNRVFIWKDFNEWKPGLEAMFPGILTPELQAKVRQEATLVRHSDDAEPFEQLSGHSLDDIITTDKIDKFRRLYSHIRVFHACRTADIQSYRKEGVTLRCKDDQVKRFRDIFLSGSFPELSETMLQESIAKLEGSDPDGILDLGLDDKWIIEITGHYLIYGSEYLHSLVSQLPIDREKRDQYHAVLRHIGTPTFLLIDLPNTREYASDGTLWQLIPEMIMNWVYNVAHSRIESGALDFTFTIRKPLPAEHICGYLRPPRIPDPHMGWKVYVTETGEYEDRTDRTSTQLADERIWPAP